MAKTPLRFAMGAATPLYLPLYVFQRHRGFNLNIDYAIDVFTPAKGNENGDVAAAQHVVAASAEFALCDPVIAEAIGEVRIVATIVDRMAFWAVARRNIRYIEDFKEFKTIFTYPEGMTGYYVARSIQKQFKNRLEVVPCSVDSELDALKAATKPAVALTANLLLARRFVNENPGYEISSVWKLDPSFSSVMLTGLLARVETIETDHELIRKVVTGINRSIALLMSDGDEGALALQDAHQVADKSEADYFVNQARSNQLYPTVLTPELTSWHNLREVHKRGSSSRGVATPIKAEQPSSRTFFDCVRARAARDAETLTLKVLARFGKGELYLDVAESIEQTDVLSLDDLMVVGAYKRWSDNDRDALKGWVERISRAVVTASHSDENFLIWGTSGSGKTFLIEQLGGSLQSTGACYFEKIDVTKKTPDQVRAAVSALEAESRPVLCLLDEIDATTELTSDYSFLFQTLRWRRANGKRIVFALAGSGGHSVAELAAKIAGRERGPDLLSFVPLDQRFQIPDYTMWDRLVIFIAAAIGAREKAGGKLGGLQKLALYHVAVNGPTDARGLAREGESAANRMRSGDERLTYEHLFDPFTGADSQYSFIAEHYDTGQRLIGRFLTTR